MIATQFARGGYAGMEGTGLVGALHAAIQFGNPKQREPVGSDGERSDIELVEVEAELGGVFFDDTLGASVVAAGAGVDLDGEGDLVAR